MSFGMLIYPGVEELDFQGPWEMVGIWNKYANGPKPVLLAGQLEPVTCAHGMRVLPDQTYESVGHLTQLLVPGGFSAIAEMKNSATVNFIKEVFLRGVPVMSVCSGVFILQAAGVLDGKMACTNWKAAGHLSAMGIEVVSERYVRDQGVRTSAGVSAGIDMLLSYIAETEGEEIASTVQLHAEYFPNAKIYGQQRFLQAVSEYIYRM